MAENAEEIMDAKKVTDFKRNKLKYGSAQARTSNGPILNSLSNRRNSWPPVVYETLRHTTSGIFDPLEVSILTTTFDDNWFKKLDHFIYDDDSLYLSNGIAFCFCQN